MPLIVDDLIVHLDNASARGALEILAELSRNMQILFLTHHGFQRSGAGNGAWSCTSSAHRGAGALRSAQPPAGRLASSLLGPGVLAAQLSQLLTPAEVRP